MLDNSGIFYLVKKKKEEPNLEKKIADALSGYGDYKNVQTLQIWLNYLKNNGTYFQWKARGIETGRISYGVRIVRCLPVACH